MEHEQEDREIWPVAWGVDVDNKAKLLGRMAGIAEAHTEGIIQEARERMPAMLIGGYHLDYVIVGLWLALHEEEGISEEDIWARITEATGAAWAGLI